MYLFLKRDYEFMLGEIERLENRLRALYSKKSHIYNICIVECRLRDLKEIRENSRIINPNSSNNTAGIGSKVRVIYNAVGSGCDKKEKYGLKSEVIEIGSYIVFKDDINVVSYDSHIGRMLNGAKVGQSFRMNNNKLSMTITEIK